MRLSRSTQTRLNQLLDRVGDMSLKRRAFRLILELDPKNGERIIDIGTGTGYYLYLLSNLGLKLDLTGFDSDEKALNEARQTLSNHKIKFIHGDILKMPFKSNTFDKVIMSEVIEHLLDDVNSLKEVKRVLRKGGIMVLSTPSFDYPLLWDPINWMLMHLLGKNIKSGFWSGIWNQHIRLYRQRELKKVLEKAGFHIEQLEQLTYWCLPFNHYLVNIIARMLYDYNLPISLTNSLSKFKKTKKPLWVKIGFGFVNAVDKLNDLFPQKTGAGLFAKVRKN